MVAERRRVALIVVEPDSDSRMVIVRALDAQVISISDPAELSGRVPAMPTVVLLGPSITVEDRARLESFLPPRQALRLVSFEGFIGSDVGATSSDVQLPWPSTDAEIVAAADRLAIELVGSAPASVATASNGMPDRGHLTTVFSAKGGSGTSVVATNLAAALAREVDGPVVLVDADVAAGDVAVMLRLSPDYTLFDAAESGGPLDEGLLERMLVHHPATGVYVLAAPFEPAFASRIASSQLDEVLSVLRRGAAHVVVDTSVHIDDLLLTVLAASDDVILVAGPEVPNIKGLTIGLQILGLVDHPPGRVQVVINRADAPVGLSIQEIEQAVGVGIDELIPSDIGVPMSVNEGVPIVVSEPDHAVSDAFRSLAALVTDDLAPVDQLST